MFHEIFGRGCGCGPRERKPMSMLASCDILWIIILLLILFNGGLLGLDLCTIVILVIVFGPKFLCKDKKHEPRC